MVAARAYTCLPYPARPSVLACNSKLWWRSVLRRVSAPNRELPIRGSAANGGIWPEVRMGALRVAVGYLRVHRKMRSTTVAADPKATNGNH